MIEKNKSALEARLHYRFSDQSLLDLALRHSSYSAKDNQRLEFLGDRVLGLVIAETLYKNNPEMTEGDLAPRFNYLVRKGSCAMIADNLKLGEEIYLGRSEAKSGGRRKVTLLGDVMEAVIAAIYLDGGFAAAQEFINRHWESLLNEMPEQTVDAKTQLQEFMQSQSKDPPSYEITKREGPDHAPIFHVECRADGHSAHGEGTSKRAAEQRAASAFLLTLKGEA